MKKTDANTLNSPEFDSQMLKALRDGFPKGVRRRNQPNSTDKVAVASFLERSAKYGVAEASV